MTDGEAFGKHVLVRELGRGGKGVVYEALDTVLGRRVALKRTLPVAGLSDERQKQEDERFLVEARLSANLPKHPHIVTVYEAGVIDGKRYMAMELVGGQPLMRWRKSSAPPLPDQVRLLREVAQAVGHAHRHGIVHRDLKPANILVDAEGAPHVTDFGLAVPVERAAEQARQGELVWGTPSYMSPEQAQGLRTLDHRSDLYSLGVMLYEMVAGHATFQGSTAQEIMQKVVYEPVPSSPRFTEPGEHHRLRRALEGVCRKALSKDPAARHASAAELADELARALGQGTVSLRKASPPRTSPALKLAALAGGVVAAAVLLALFFGRDSNDTLAADLAEGDRLLAEGRPEEALRSFDRAEAIDPGNGRAAHGRTSATAQLQARFQAEKDRAAKAAAGAARREVEEKSREDTKRLQAEIEARQRASDEEQLRLRAEQARLESERKAAEERARVAEAAAKRAQEQAARPVTPAPVPAPATPPTPPAPAPAPPPAAPKRLAPPPAASLRESEKVIRDLFKADYARRGPLEQAALAAKLLAEGTKIQDDPAVKFVMLSEARDVAAAAGGQATAMSAIDELASAFTVDATALRIATLATVAKSVRSPEAAEALADAYLGVMDQAVEADDFDTAASLAPKAEAAARGSQNAGMAARVQARGREIAAMRDELRPLKPAMKTLEEKPDDPAANLALGLYRCFSRNDWARGLPMLAKGSDPALAALAAREATPPEEAAAQASLADAWREAADKKGAPLKGRIQSRALTWYEKALAGLEGLARLKVEGQVETLTKALTGTDATRKGLVFWVEPGKDPSNPGREIVFGAKGLSRRPAVLEAGVRGFALSGGTMDYAAAEPVRSIEKQGSVFMWIKAGADLGSLVARADPGTGAYDFWLWLGAGVQVVLYSNWPEWQGAYSGPALPPGKWALLGVTWDEKTLSFYVDGKESGATPVVANSLPRRRASRLLVGADPSGEKVDASGLLGSVMIYNRTFSAQEASLLHLSSRARFR